MNRGDRVWSVDDRCWASYEFRCIDQEPLGHHSIYLDNNGGRRVVCGCKLLLEPASAHSLVGIAAENERMMQAEINRINDELSSLTAFVAERVLRNYYLYSGYQIKDRGPVGIMHDILRRVFPAAQKRIAAGEHPDAVYTDCFGAQDEEPAVVDAPLSPVEVPAEELSAGLTDDDMRSSPLSLADLRATVRSAHAFWRMPLRCKEHDSGLDVEVFSNGTIETHCRECKQLLGVLLLVRVTPPAGAP